MNIFRAIKASSKYTDTFFEGSQVMLLPQFVQKLLGDPQRKVRIENVDCNLPILRTEKGSTRELLLQAGLAEAFLNG